MLDLKYYINNEQQLLDGLTKKGVGIDVAQALLKELKEVKEARKDLEDMLANKNTKSKEFGALKAQKKDTTELSKQLSELNNKIDITKEEVIKKEAALEKIALQLPNIPQEKVPNGNGEEDNIEIKKVLTKPTYSFNPKEHWDLAEVNDWVDFKRGVKLAKTRFSVLKGEAARLERALINFFLDHNRENGFEEYCVPFINNADMLKGTGQLPKFENDLFKIEGEDLYLIPTAEVPLTNMFNDEILEKEELPVLMTGYTPCFRKEAGNAGRDTRGLIRQHQFSKVEMVALCEPQQAEGIFDMMVKNASDILTKLGLHHRLVELCDGDLGFSSARTIDLEVWMPGCKEFREISSVSNMTDFQARRAKIRYKDGKKNVLVNTLNGSSLAVGRTIAAIMETYQNEDGTITIPQILKRYM